jgi:hypothetical protein
MKRIYLDQNVWIELSRARLGSVGAKQAFGDAYHLARHAAAHGAASFVLSQTHMYETQKRQQFDKRLDVVETMIELSHMHTIKHVTSVVPLEADFAVRYLADIARSEPNVFGYGVRNMLANDAGVQTAPQGFSLQLLGYRASFLELATSRDASYAWDSMLIAGPPAGTTDPHITATLDNVDTAFAVDQAQVAAKLKQLNVKGPLLEDALMQYTLLEVRHEVLGAASNAGVSPEAVVDFMVKDPRRMLNLLPSRRVVLAMYMQHAQPQKAWKANDLHDITALGVAVPYCDAVATERHWVSMLHRPELDTALGTTLIDSPNGLVEYLAQL